MKKITIFLFAWLLMILNSCTEQPVVSEKMSETIPCDFVEFILPVPDYKNGEYASYNYFAIDRAKQNADSIISIHLSENANIDSLFQVIDKHQEVLWKDSLENEKWQGIRLKTPQMPLNVFTEVLCHLQNNMVRDYMTERFGKFSFFYLDLRYDEFIFFLFNKKYHTFKNRDKLSKEFDNKEYLEYLKHADYDALERIKSLTERRNNRHRFRTSPTLTTPVQQALEIADTTIRFRWNSQSNISLQLRLDSLDSALSDFKDKYQKLPLPERKFGDTITIPCKRNVFSIHFDKNIPLAEIIRMVNKARKYQLLQEVDVMESRLNICTLCDVEETERSHSNY
jgi:hypothetical protein